MLFSPFYLTSKYKNLMFNKLTQYRDIYIYFLASQLISFKKFSHFSIV